MTEGADKERPPLPTRKLRVTGYDKIGQTQKGAPIFKVTAVQENGAPVELELRSFQELPVGEVIEYALKKYVHPQYGDTYTLYPPPEKLGTRVTKLEQRLEEIEKRLQGLESGLGGTPDDFPL
jgi:hypothetical protein